MAPDCSIPLFRPAAPWQALGPALKERVEAFLAGGRFVDGPWVEAFEAGWAERFGFAAAVGTASGTAALELALRAAGIGPGDEVITVANTYYATARAIRQVGARPVFVDVSRQTAQMDARAAAQAVGPRTGAILSVWLYGWPPPSTALRELAHRHGLLYIEDCAHAPGGGKDADVACFSFYPTKPLGALGDAGLLATGDPDLARRARRLRYFADATRTRFEPGALHARLDALQAALLLLRLPSLAAEVAARRERAAAYRRFLRGTEVELLAGEDGQAIPYVFPLRVAAPAAVQQRLQAAGLEAGRHYPTVLATLPEFRGEAQLPLPETERHCARVLTLPVYPELPLETVGRVARAVLRAASESAAGQGER